MTRLPSSPPSYYLLLLSIALFSLLLFNYLSLRNEHHNLAMRLVLDGPCTQDCEEDSLLVEHIRKTALVQPSGRMPILKIPGSVNQKGQTGQVNRILKHYDNKKNGFFIEAGAWDGEALSNTIHLETTLGWTGLLVEPNKAIFDILVAKERNAYSINSCLSINRYAEKVNFDAADVFGAIESDVARKRANTWRSTFLRKEVARETNIVQCFPLYSILLALGNPRVDFLSLDIEGSEEDVLGAIPFDKVDIQLILVETAHSNLTAINAIMAKSGYDITPVPPYDHMYIKKV